MAPDEIAPLPETVHQAVARVLSIVVEGRKAHSADAILDVLCFELGAWFVQTSPSEILKAQIATPDLARDMGIA